MPIYDCKPYIVVLGHLMDENGFLNDETSRRVAYAAQIDDNLSSLAIILCGWAYRPDSDITIASAMRRYLKQTRPDLMAKSLIQSLSRDTVGDAFFSRLLLQCICKACKPDIVVVTSDYHVKRTLDVFEFVFHGYAGSVDVQGCKLAVADSSRLRSEWQSTSAFRNTFCGIDPGDMNAIRDAMAVGHPFYNGSAHPIIDSLQSAVHELRQFNLTA